MTDDPDIESGADTDGSLIGQFLIAMPGMEDPRFQRSVIFVCAHSDKGAMGLVVNKPINHLRFADLLEQLEIATDQVSRSLPIHFGGPVESGRGFVLHSLDYCLPEATLRVNASVGLTATVDVLRAIAGGKGPWQALFALGYAGWRPGQLEGEIRANGWLTCPADESLLFSEEVKLKWQRALHKLGIDPAMLVSKDGTAWTN